MLRSIQRSRFIVSSTHFVQFGRIRTNSYKEGYNYNRSFAGHSHYANIKHKKKRNDEKRAVEHRKLVQEIGSAIKTGGSNDPTKNHLLLTAIQRAKKGNLPKSRIENVLNPVQKSAHPDSLQTFEGRGPGGVSIVVEIVSNNRNKAVSSVKACFKKYEELGAMILSGKGGALSLFQSMGSVRFRRGELGEDDLLELAAEGNALDMKSQDDLITFHCPKPDLNSLKSFLEEREIEIEEFLVDLVPITSQRGLEDEQVDGLLSLVTELESEGCTVYHNYREERIL